MAKIRVHELAKQEGMPSKEVIARLQAAGLDVKAAASSVDVDLAKEALHPTPKPKVKPAASKPAASKPATPKSNGGAPARQSALQGGRGQSSPRSTSGGQRAQASASRPPSAGGGAPARPAASGKRRRVVIDSQASRRPTGPPPPGGGPPGRRGKGRRRRPVYDDTPPETKVEVMPEGAVAINSGATVKEVAETLGLSAADVIKQLMQLGEMATMTQTLADEAIQVLADAFEKKIEIIKLSDDGDAPVVPDDEDDGELMERPPVITIMGHVDHGKTSLLDAIRETEVVESEAGGITQHIGAYQVHHNQKLVTFIDTPGHQAFTAMRARGAKVTDVAVIVVAADDGVMPQTEEAIDHAKAANVPLVFAVNKIDKEGADPQRVRNELAQRGFTPEDWGGDTIFCDVSAKARTGLDHLLDMLLLVAEVQELKGNPDADASGTVVESQLDPGRGPVVTLLIQRGRLNIGDALVAGSQWGRVRAMQDHTGTRLKHAELGMPVEVLGFDGVPEAGDLARVVKNERLARTIAGDRANRLKTEAIARRQGVKVSLEDVFARVQEGAAKELNLIVKGDVAGSLEALEDEIAKLPQGEVRVNVIHHGVGGINESDVMLAAASEAVVLGFNVRPVGDANLIASREGVQIRTYTVIYKAIEELRNAMQGMLDPEEVEDALGTIEVRQTFKASKIGTIAGGHVTSGKVTRNSQVRLVRDGTVIYEGGIASLKRFNEDVREVGTDLECGIVLTNYDDVKEGDVVEAFETRKVERELK